MDSTKNLSLQITTYTIPTGVDSKGERKGDSHTYDGDPNIQKMIKEMGITKSLVDLSKKHEMFKELKRKINEYNSLPRMKQAALHCVDVITTHIQKSPNYDSSNNVYADDLLAFLCNLNIEEGMLFITEQLADVVCSGQCPIGRCIRIVQLCLAFESKTVESLDGENPV